MEDHAQIAQHHIAARGWHNMGSGRMDDSVNERDNLAAALELVGRR